jgi:hypothetical protein
MLPLLTVSFDLIDIRVVAPLFLIFHQKANNKTILKNEIGFLPNDSVQSSFEYFCCQMHRPFHRSLRCFN